MSEYLIPSEESFAEVEIKRSRFLITVRPITSMEEMKRFLKEKREEHPKANHNCWAVISGAPSDSNGYGFSDDGEPSGCAGKPIFTVLQYSGIGQIGMVVTRYFGGIKLGTGGMVKAYTEAAKAGVESIRTIAYSPMVTLRVEVSYAQEPHLRHLLDQEGQTNAVFSYGQGVIAELPVRKGDAPALKLLLREQLGHDVPLKLV
ncbi:MAG: YigZ family protein [Pontiellaceae bacterium]|nr:YigZ family protein [Pontiellaceae bacterium]MBN2783192.1 YigZ family protein [Pontiellaceae bacterium]